MKNTKILEKKCEKYNFDEIIYKKTVKDKMGQLM